MVLNVYNMLFPRSIVLHSAQLLLVTIGRKVLLQQQQEQQQTNHHERSKKLYIYQREDYDEGMDVFNHAILINNNNYNNSSCCSTLPSVMATLLYNLGQICIRLGEDDEATTYFNQALAILDTPMGQQGYYNYHHECIYRCCVT